MIRRFKRILVLIKCLLFVLIRGKANKSVSKPQNVVVIQLAKMGDMVCTTPMFRAIKKAYPSCKITVVGDNINKELLAGHLDVDSYIVWDKNNSPSFFRDIKRGEFGFGCITGPNFEALATLFLSGVPLISVPKVENGWSPYETIPYKILRMFAVTKSHRMGEYAPREYLRLLEPIGIRTKGTQKTVYYSNEAVNKVEELLAGKMVTKQNLLIGISPSAGNKIKNWGGEKFAKLADFLSEKYGASIFVIGGPRDKEEVDEMIANILPTTKVINIVEQLNLDELKALISKLDLFISVDTGPIYIAEALGIATIDILGPMNATEQSPTGPRHILVEIKDRVPQLYIMNARVYDQKEARRQIEAISVEMVTRAIDQLIK